MIWRATILALAVGVGGTAAGGLLAAALGRPKRWVSCAMLGFSAGIMLAIIGLDLFPEAIRRGGLLVTSLGMLLGVALIYALDIVLPHRHPDPDDAGTAELPGTHDRRGRPESRFERAALFIGLAVALHNFPEGVAMGSSYASGVTFGLVVAALIFAQNVPEGLAIAAPYLAAGRSRLKVLALTSLAGLPEAVGALVGATLAGLSPVVLSLALAFSGGAMLFIVGDELLPLAIELAPGHTAAFGLVAGMLSGMVLTALLAGV